MTMANDKTVSPLFANIKLVNSDGTPTDWFIRWAQERSEDINGNVPPSRTINTGTGLTGGGDLSEDRTLSLDDTAVDPGTYGDATNSAQITVDQQGRITDIVDVPITGGGGGGGGVLGYAQNYTAAVQSSNTGTASVPITAMSITTAVAAGFVKLSWSVIGIVASGGEKRIFAIQDGVDYRPGDPTSSGATFYTRITEVDRNESTAFVIMPVTAGTHTFQIGYQDALAATGVTWLFCAMTLEQM